MDLVRKLYVKAQEFPRGQTMAEYALLVSAIAVVAYAGYKLTGTTISTLLASVDGNL
jgi:Flp pilus assembly pilin Flp